MKEALTMGRGIRYQEGRRQNQKIRVLCKGDQESSELNKGGLEKIWMKALST